MSQHKALAGEFVKARSNDRVLPGKSHGLAAHLVREDKDKVRRFARGAPGPRSFGFAK